MFNSINVDCTVLNEDIEPISDAFREEHHLSVVACKITLPTYTMEDVLVKGYGAGIMKIETDCNVVELRCSLTTPSVMDILPGKPFYKYNENFTA